MDKTGLLNPTLMDFFLKGNLSLEICERKNPYSWFPEAGWHDLMRLAAIAEEGSNPALKEVVGDIEKDEYAWKCYYDLEDPETAMLPNGYESRVGEFEKLLLLRCIKMDRVTVRSQSSHFNSMHGISAADSHTHSTLDHRYTANLGALECRLL